MHGLFVRRLAMACSLFAMKLNTLCGLLVIRLMVPIFSIMRTATGSVLFSSNSEQHFKFDNFLFLLCGRMKLVSIKTVDVLL
jgi:hypothetical protein